MPESMPHKHSIATGTLSVLVLVTLVTLPAYSNSSQILLKTGKYQSDRYYPKVPYSYSPLNTNCTGQQVQTFIDQLSRPLASPFNYEYSALVACGSNAVPQLIETLSKSTNERARFNIAMALQEIPTKRDIIPSLIQSLKSDKSPLVRAILIDVLCSKYKNTDKRVISALQVTSKDKGIITHTPFSDDGIWTVGQYAAMQLKYLETSDDKKFTPTLHEQKCPARHIIRRHDQTEFLVSYRFNKKTNQCVINEEETHEPPATGAWSLLQSLCLEKGCAKGSRRKK